MKEIFECDFKGNEGYTIASIDSFSKNSEKNDFWIKNHFIISLTLKNGNKKTLDFFEYTDLESEEFITRRNIISDKDLTKTA
jgi:hypothetical protein